MKFNVAKCKVVHFGPRSPRFSYMMNGIELEESREEKDLGIIVTDKLSVSTQCAKAAKTANTVLGQISRAFHFRDKDIFTGLYKQYVRPHFGICSTGLVTLAGEGQGDTRVENGPPGPSQAYKPKITWAV